MLVVLSNTEIAILESSDLRPQIDSIAADLHVSWAVEQSKNKTQAAISRLLGPVSSSKEEYELEIAATNFMSAIGKLTLPAFEEKKEEKDEKKEDEDPEDPEKEIEFIKDLLDNIDDARGAMILHKGASPVILAMTNTATIIGHYSLKRMCKAYLKVYGK